MDCCCLLFEDLPMAVSFNEFVTFELIETVAIEMINQEYCWFILIIKRFDFQQVK